MIFPVNKVLKITDKIKGKLLGATFSYMSAKVIGLVDEATNVQELWELKATLVDMTRPSNILLWVGVVATILVYVSNYVLHYIAKAQNPSANFRKIMAAHTADVISELSSKTYSWGYNYCIHYPRDPRGWSPDAFVIGEYENTNGDFPDVVDKNLPGYGKASFKEYCNVEPKVKAILRKNENRDRFAVRHIKCNSNRTSQKVDIKLKKN